MKNKRNEPLNTQQGKTCGEGILTIAYQTSSMSTPRNTRYAEMIIFMANRYAKTKRIISFIVYI